MPEALTKDRVVRAVLETIDSWEETALSIADDLEPGRKAKALSLARDMLETRRSLEKMTQTTADD